MAGQRVTMRDVAKRAQVSTATVSYVLNNQNRVGDATRQRVVIAMQELAYCPSTQGRSPVRQKTNLIGFLISHHPNSVFLDPYFAEIMLGVAVMADAHEYSPVMVTVDGEAHAQEVYGRYARNGLVDGLIVSFISERDSYLLNQVARDGIPFVIVGSAGNRKDTSVDVDNRGGAEQAVAHLIGLGHRNIGFINGPDDSPHAKQRLHGFRSALLDFNRSLDSSTILNGGFTREGGYVAMAHLLDAETRPTAVFAASDHMAVGALQCLHERGLQIPRDLSLVSFDDTLLSTSTYPRLTTVHQPIRKLGEVAMDLLFKKIHGLPSQSSIILPTELIVRESSGPVA